MLRPSAKNSPDQTYVRIYFPTCFQTRFATIPNFMVIIYSIVNYDLENKKRLSK